MQVQLRDIDQARVGCKAVVESFQPKLADYGPETDVFADQGMGFNMGWIWGHCTTEDGRPHMFARWLGQDEIVTYTWTISSPDLFSQAEIVAAPVPGLEKLYQGEVRWHTEADQVAMRSYNPAYTQRVEATFKPGEIRLVDGEHFDITIRPVGSALKFHVPGPPAVMGYTSEIGVPSGTIGGSSITGGFAGLDRSFGLAGHSFYRDKLHSILEEFWIVWGGLDDEGRGQHGHFSTGPGGFCVGIFERDGSDGEAPISVTTDGFDHFDIEWAAQGDAVRPRKARFGFGGFEFEGDFTGSNLLPGAEMNMDWVIGRMSVTNRDDIADSTGFCEYFKNLTIVD